MKPILKSFVSSGKFGWLINALIFQVGWMVCVLGGNLWAVLFTLLVLAFHFRCYTGARQSCPKGLAWHQDSTAVLVALFMGLLHDNFLARAGVLVFAGDSFFSPVWLWCLWILMALTFNHSLQWVYRRPWIAALGGAVSGPLAYAGGVALSDVDWGIPFIEAMLVLVIVWLFVLPLHRYLTLGIGYLCTRQYSP